jgi:selenocysteine-specific elongation factor
VPDEVSNRLKAIESLRTIHGENQTIYVSRDRLEEYKNRVIRKIEETHTNEPNKLGVERAALLESAGKGVRAEVFDWVIDSLLKEGSYTQTKGLIQRKGYRLSFSSEDEDPKNRILDLYRQAGYNPPKIEEAAKRLQLHPNYAKKIVGSLREMGTLVPVTGEAYFHESVIREAEEKLKVLLHDREKIKVAEYRDIMGFGRKLSIELLEYFDRVGLTRRDGDFRRLVKK